MKQTLLKIQELLDEIVYDTKLLNLDLLMNRVERVRQLIEGVIREMESKDAEPIKK